MPDGCGRSRRRAVGLPCALLTIAICLLPYSLAAQERHGTEPGTQAELPRIPAPQGIETATADETGHGHWHKHHAGLFVGGSSIKSETGFTLGGDYEYRLSKYIGVGGQVEHGFGDLKETVAAFPLFFHPGAGLRLGTGPGFEKFSGELPTSTSVEGNGEDAGGGDKDFHFLWRIQVLYDFPLDERFTVTPSFAIDFQSGRQVFVYGITLGFGF